MKTVGPTEDGKFMGSEATGIYRDGIADIVPALEEKVKTFAIVEPDRGVDLALRMSQISDSSVLVFDFDGTIADTEKVHLAAYNLLLKRMGVELSKEQFDKYRGNTEFDIYKLIEHDFGIEIPKENFRSERLAIFLEIIDKMGVAPFGYVAATMEQAAAAGALSIIVSSQLVSVVAHLLGKWQLADRLAGIFASDLFGCRKIEIIDSLPIRFHRDANNFIVFEDSPFVVTHARSIGMGAHLVTS